MLDRYGWHKCKVKAVALSPLKEKPSELDKVYGRLKTKETEETVYLTCKNLKLHVQIRNTPMFSSSYEPTNIK